MKGILAILILCAVSAQEVNGQISSVCLDCIGTVEGGPPNECRMDVGSLSCGRYQIKYPYWQDCQAGTDWKTCSFDESCARQCITNYISRYSSICARELGKTVQELTCYDMGRVHNGGPHGCSKPGTMSYVNAMKRKCSLSNN